MAVLADVGGAMIGMWQPDEHRGGVVATAGAPCHFELFTRDYEQAVQFYKDVFGWDPETAGDEPDFRYTCSTWATARMPGSWTPAPCLPEGVPAHWSVYFAVDDVDQTLAKVQELGGATIAAAENTPYGVLATAADATGAIFKLRADS